MAMLRRAAEALRGAGAGRGEEEGKETVVVAGRKF